MTDGVSTVNRVGHTQCHQPLQWLHRVVNTCGLTKKPKKWHRSANGLVKVDEELTPFEKKS